MHTANPSQTLLIACEVLISELIPLLPPGMTYRSLDVGLHVNPKSLHEALQKAINEANPDLKTTILGYGLCSRSVEGLTSDHSYLVIPRIDDCIGILLGSRKAHLLQTFSEPGTYYLSQGWIDAGKHIFEEYEYMVERFGVEKANQLMNAMMKHYTRLAYLTIGKEKNIEHYKDYCRSVAARFHLRYEEIQASETMLKKIVQGPWST